MNEQDMKYAYTQQKHAYAQQMQAEQPSAHGPSLSGAGQQKQSIAEAMVQELSMHNDRLSNIYQNLLAICERLGIPEDGAEAGPPHAPDVSHPGVLGDVARLMQEQSNLLSSIAQVTRRVGRL